MCFMASMVEMFAMATAILSGFLGAQLQELSVPNIHFPDAVVMSIIIPFIHLLNQEETKGIIFENGWFQGFRYAFGRYTDSENESRARKGSSNRTNDLNLNTSRHKSLSSQHPNLLQVSKKQLSIRRCKSSSDLVLEHDLSINYIKDKIMNFKRRHSIENTSPKTLVNCISKSTTTFEVSTSIEMRISHPNLTFNRIAMSGKSSSSSISTIYLND